MLVFLFYTELPSLLSVFIAIETNPDERSQPTDTWAEHNPRMRIKTRGVEVGSGSAMEVGVDGSVNITFLV